MAGMGRKVDQEGDAGSTTPECALENSPRASRNLGQTDAKEDMSANWNTRHKEENTAMATYRCNKAPLQDFF